MEVKYSIILLLSVCYIYNPIPLVTANNSETEEKCAFENTVNLTNCHRFENGSYLYRGILIPSEKQHFYDYELRFLGVKKSVPVHLRGCACDEKPCMKLCCAEDEYLNTTGMCEKLTEAMEVRWDLLVGFNDTEEGKVVNIFELFTTQTGLPCDKAEALDSSIDKWILTEDGILNIVSDNAFLTTRDYCYSPRFLNDSENYQLTPFSCPMKTEKSWKLILNTYAMAVSVLFLIPTIVVYFTLKQLRENLRGKLLICYLISLTMGYGIISFINISGIRFNFIQCNLLGFTCYFFFMAAFFWLSVFCLDIWNNFKDTNIELNYHKKNRKQFIVYSLFAWLGAGAATGGIIFIQFSTMVDDEYKPGIGEKVCWLDTDKWSAAMYFYGPNLFILLINCVTFSHLTVRIYKVRRDLAKITLKQKFFQENAIVILRLFLIMGISWIFDIISYCMRNYEDWDFLFVLSDFGNAIQGISIFCLFVLKANVRELLMKRFKRQRNYESGVSLRLQTSSTVPTTTTQLSP